MKKTFTFFLIFILIFSSSCTKSLNDNELDISKTPNDSDIAQSETEDDGQQTTKAEEYVMPEYTSSGTDCEIVELVSKSDFSEDIIFDYKETTITVEKPKFTGIKIDEVYSYKDYYEFNNDGLTSISIGNNNYLILNTKAQIVEIATSPVQDNCARDYANHPWKTEGRPISEKTMIIQTGEPGNYRQRLHSYSGEPLSDYFDSISYFYNGLALVKKNYKIGIIDESGTTLLEPCIAFDKITYPPTERYFSVQFMDRDAFILSIGGELAVINLIRTNNI